MALSLTAIAIAAPASAQDYPSRPVRIVVPFGTGTGTGIDGVARALATRLATELGQPVTVENRAGASGMIGAEVVSTAPADGHTLLLASVSVFSVNPVTFAKIPYDSLKSFTPISMVYSQPMVVAASMKMPARTLPELVSLAKAKPDSVSAGTLGSFQALAVQQFASATGTRILNVPYRNAALMALVGGEIDMTLDVISLVLPQSRADKVKALAVTSAKRSPLAPDIPSVAEFGYADFDMTAWTALVGPPEMPRPVVERINRAIVRIIENKEVVDQFGTQGITMVSSSPEQLAAHLQAEQVRWQKAAQDAGIKPQ
ncbi:MAG: Bug family tripartite tricarboxylate transporter substrate binding protein [Lautropia sp.]